MQTPSPGFLGTFVQNVPDALQWRGFGWSIPTAIILLTDSHFGRILITELFCRFQHSSTFII